jgi:hypothetical protein
MIHFQLIHHSIFDPFPKVPLDFNLPYPPHYIFPQDLPTYIGLLSYHYRFRIDPF